jgi:hypothetical protein
MVTKREIQELTDQQGPTSLGMPMPLKADHQNHYSTSLLIQSDVLSLRTVCVTAKKHYLLDECNWRLYGQYPKGKI